jgi:signal transduction histidine kinase
VHLEHLLEEARNLAFADAGIEEAYRADRMKRDALQAQRVLMVLIMIVAVIGVAVASLTASRGLEIPTPWMIVRVSVLIPLLFCLWLLTRQDWGKRNLQLVLGAGMPLVLGGYAFEWSSEWVPAMPLRGVWAAPLLALWACAMALPMGTRAVASTTLGVMLIATAGFAMFVSGLDGPMIAVVTVIYGVAGCFIILFAKWREVDNRETFVHRREIQMLSEELRERNEALVQVNNLRDAFIEGVLHDIRSPLTAIFLSSSMLREQAKLPEADKAELVDGIVKAGTHIDTFVTRFLEQRSLDRADAPPDILDVELDSAVDNVVTRARIAAVTKGQELVVESFLPQAIVRVDELLLDRALSNLLDNAIKYSPIDGRIVLRIEDDPVAQGRARLAITDHGPGISDTEKALLFQPYSRLEKPTTGGEHSVGLGLSLVKKWVEAMGGAVGCESELDRGATFWFSVPMKQAGADLQSVAREDRRA